MEREEAKPPSTARTGHGDKGEERGKNLRDGVCVPPQNTFKWPFTFLLGF